MVDDPWKKKLTPEQYRVMREKGTERPFTGKYWNCDEKGVYHCAACGEPLFDSGTKFDSGCGWPSFFAPYESDSVSYDEDPSHGMHRIEILCKNCGSHLGHVFDDGPVPTFKRYCVNSCCLHLKKA